MIESETTAAFSNTDLRRARFWIQRWRQIGGGFIITPAGEGTYSVDAIRQESADPKLEKHYAKAQPELLKELERDRKKSDTVVALAIEAHERSQPRPLRAAQDNAPEPQDDPPTAA